MNKVNKTRLLKIQEVIDEINKHLWIESEKAGHDLGFQTAADDWLEKYSQSWIDFHMPSTKKSATKPKPKTKLKKTPAKVVKKRKAKSYAASKK